MIQVWYDPIDLLFWLTWIYILFIFIFLFFTYGKIYIDIDVKWANLALWTI